MISYVNVVVKFSISLEHFVMYDANKLKHLRRSFIEFFFFFSRIRKRAAYQYIKKKKGGEPPVHRVFEGESPKNPYTPKYY
jgi:hypothetical protein